MPVIATPRQTSDMTLSNSKWVMCLLRTGDPRREFVPAQITSRGNREIVPGRRYKSEHKRAEARDCSINRTSQPDGAVQGTNEKPRSRSQSGDGPRPGRRPEVGVSRINTLGMHQGTVFRRGCLATTRKPRRLVRALFCIVPISRCKYRAVRNQARAESPRPALRAPRRAHNPLGCGSVLPENSGSWVNGKLGHCEILLRTLVVKTGQRPIPVLAELGHSEAYVKRQRKRLNSPSVTIKSTERMNERGRQLRRPLVMSCSGWRFNIWRQRRQVTLCAWFVYLQFGRLIQESCGNLGVRCCFSHPKQDRRLTHEVLFTDHRTSPRYPSAADATHELDLCSKPKVQK